MYDVCVDLIACSNLGDVEQLQLQHPILTGSWWTHVQRLSTISHASTYMPPSAGADLQGRGAPAPLQLMQQWRYGEGEEEEEVEERTHRLVPPHQDM
jgi:hypothetical protein